MSNNHVSDILNVAEAMAKKYFYRFKPFGKSIDELESDLYTYLLEQEKEEGKELDIPLMIDICKKHIVDLQRYAMKRNTVDYDAWENDVNSAENANDASLHSHISSDFTQDLMIDGLLRRYEENTRERIYIEFMLDLAGLYEYGGKYGFDYDTRGAGRKSSPESQLASYLGFPSSSSSAYRTFRDKMRKEVAEYFDI